MPLRQKIQTAVSYKFVSYMRVLTVYIYMYICTMRSKISSTNGESIRLAFTLPEKTINIYAK